MNSDSILEYYPGKTFIHKLQGATKLLFLITVSFAVMVIYHIWFLLFIFTLSMMLLFLANIKWHQVSFIFKCFFLFVSINHIIIFSVFSNHGSSVYDSKTVLFPHTFFEFITKEQLFYHFNLFLKSACIIPLFLIFILTTNPSELSASLNKMGLSYKISYALALTIRYIPEIQKDFINISKTQQARGKYLLQNKNFIHKIIINCQKVITIIIPLIFVNLEKIDHITNAMKLRRFGVYKKRTWYAYKPFGFLDLLTLLLGVILLSISFYLLLHGDRFYYPFTKNSS